MFPSHDQWEIRKLREALNPIGRVVTLYGGTDDRNESINDFIAGHARFLIAHPASAAHGLTFVNCSTEIFFSLDFSWERYEQSRGRIHRAGQTKKCTYIHIIAHNTVDESILKVLKRKGQSQELIYELIKQGEDNEDSINSHRERSRD